jgi:AraC family transcriptional regulator
MNLPAGENTLIDAKTGASFPAAPRGGLRHSSRPLGWRGVLVESHSLEPTELSEHTVIGHGMSVNMGASVPFGWRGRGGWRDREIRSGESHLLTFGELNTPRWHRPFDELSIILEPQYVADVVQDGLPPHRIEFVSQRSVADLTIARCARKFQAELTADAPNDLLYVDTVTTGLILHLLANYGVAKPKVIAPRGKLNSFQLRAVLDFAHSNLANVVSLAALAAQAHISPFHFARLFRRTVGLPPHQFVLRLRVDRAISLLRRGRIPLAEVAIACGFHDQPHFIRAFRRATGTTPTQYVRRAQPR